MRFGKVRSSVRSADTVTLESDSAALKSAFRDAVGGTPAENIDAVIDRLTRIIDATTIAQSRLGYFAVLYRSMTVAVRAGIRHGRFNDPELMERLDVVFANRYFSALEAHL